MPADWSWELLRGDGSAVAAPAVMTDSQRFPSQSDAETWLGEMWPALRAAGVDLVVLREADRIVYGPMSLHPSG